MIRIDKVENGSKIRINHKAYVIKGSTVTRSNGEEVPAAEAKKAREFYANAVKENAAEGKATPKVAAKGKTAKVAKAPKTKEVNETVAA